jgi:hypothetical protein
MNPKTHIILTLSLLAAGIVPATATTVIYQDDFSGTAATGIHGSVPDVRPGSQTWSAHAGVTFGPSGGAFIAASSTSRNAYLPFTPEAGHLYDLRVTVAFATTSTQTRSMQMGFFGSASPLTDSSLTDSASNGPVIFLRNVGTYEARVAGNSSLAGFNGTLTDAAILPHVLRITLDTSGAQWFMRAYIGDQQIGSGTSFAPKTIGAVGFSVNTSSSINASGTFSNFILTSEVIPEPGSILFGMMSGAALLTRRRR